MTLKPEIFGLADAAQAVRVSFLTVAIWWALFTHATAALRARESDQPRRCGLSPPCGPGGQSYGRRSRICVPTVR